MKKRIDLITKHPVLITALICFVFYFLPFEPKPFGDGEYHEGTIQLIQFVLNGFEGNVRVDKGLFSLFYYFIPYSIAYIFHNDTVYYFSGIIFNSMITCLAILLLFKSYDLMGFSNKSKFWSILALNLFPIHVYYAMGILAESGSFFAVCLFVYSWVRIITEQSSSKINYVLLSVSVAILIGFRPNLLPFAVLLVLYFLVLKIKGHYKLIFSASLIFFLILLQFAEKSMSSNNGEFKKEVFRKQLLWSRYELRDEPFNWLPQHGQDEFASSDYKHNLEKRKELDSICDVNKLDKTNYYISWVANDIIQHPFLTLRQYGLKFFQSQSFIISPLMKSNKSNWIKYGIHIYINCINYILIFYSILAVFVLLKTKKYKLTLPFLFLWGWSLVYVFMFHSEQRYLFPTRPVLLFLFAYGCNHYNNLSIFKAKILEINQ
jgi:hypothetical protein